MTASVCTSDQVRKGRPRDERIDREITEVALAVLAEDGFDGFCVERVAQRARVAKTTVYRRFPKRNELIVGALERLNDDLPGPPGPGPVRARLIEVLGGVRRRTGSSLGGRILIQAAAEGVRDPALADLVQTRVLTPRRRILRGIVADAVEAGELRDDIDVDALIPLLVGPMLYLGMWSMTQAARDVSVEAVIDTLLAGLVPRSVG